CPISVKKLLLVCSFGVVLGACHGSADDESPAAVVSVKTAVAQMQPFADIVSAIGSVNARAGHFAALSAPAPARIASVNVSLGEKVSVGTPLVAFEQAPFIAS